MKKKLQIRDRKRAARRRQLARHRMLFALLVMQDKPKLIRKGFRPETFHRLAKQGRRRHCRAMMRLAK
jgi:hypothetical protein